MADLQRAFPSYRVFLYFRVPDSPDEHTFVYTHAANPALSTNERRLYAIQKAMRQFGSEWSGKRPIHRVDIYRVGTAEEIREEEG